MSKAVIIAGQDWLPPAGMEPPLVRAWAVFYRAAAAKYRVTPVQYRDLYVAQHGCCYICRSAKGMNPDDPRGRGGRRLAVDHNHVTGAVRGLLCSGGDRTCNRIIGWLSLPQLKRAVEYVREEPGQSVLSWGQFADPDWPVGKRDTLVSGILGLK
jgi:hypothetical protein